MPTKYQSPLEKFYHWEKIQPDKVFLHQPFEGQDHTFSWKEAGIHIRAMAAHLSNLDIPAGSKIGLVSKNCAHWIITDLAIMLAGHVSVPIYPNVNSYTLNYIMLHSEAKVLFVGKLDDWEGMKGGVPETTECISFPFWNTGNHQSWDEIVDKTPAITQDIIPDPESTMTIIYTSGTTGAPKGVVHRFHSLAYATTEALSLIDFLPDSRAFSYLPLSHIAERMLVSMGCLYGGSEVYFAESLDTFVRDLCNARPTVFLGVPRIWTKFRDGILEKMPQKRLSVLLKVPILNNIVRGKIKKGLGLDGTVFFFSGAAPMPPALLTWYGKLGINIQEVYGMTENCAYSHFNRKENIKFGTVGQPLPGVEAKLSPEGEILIRSEANLRSYYKEEKMTKDAFENGFFRTGDKGTIQSDGTLTITGRVKDLFKTSKGKYVAPSPIELQISKSSLVEQVCVTGPNLPQPIALIILSELAGTQEKEMVIKSLLELQKEVNLSLEKHERQKSWVLVQDQWTVENDFLTPTLKLRRAKVEEKYSIKFEKWYLNQDSIFYS